MNQATYNKLWKIKGYCRVADVADFADVARERAGVQDMLL
jgi:hypothetical protein